MEKIYLRVDLDIPGLCDTAVDHIPANLFYKKKKVWQGPEVIEKSSARTWKWEVRWYVGGEVVETTEITEESPLGDPTPVLRILEVELEPELIPPFVIRRIDGDMFKIPSDFFRDPDILNLHLNHGESVREIVEKEMVSLFSRHVRGMQIFHDALTLACGVYQQNFEEGFIKQGLRALKCFSTRERRETAFESLFGFKAECDLKYHIPVLNDFFCKTFQKLLQVICEMKESQK